MKSFATILSETQIAELADFVSEAFNACRDIWPRYHTAGNGWSDHRERYAAAYPYVLGERPLAAASGGAPGRDGAGWRLFRETCAVCHDPAVRLRQPRVHLAQADGGPAPGPVKAPDEQRDHDAEYASEHDVPPELRGLGADEARGEGLYQDNCAICHAADGTGRNWIGSFLQPNPPDFTDRETFDGADDMATVRAILDGLPGTSMPAFRSVLSREDAAAIAAYLNRAFVAP
jgi:cytochrome c oxidase cbb3-type subunit III